MATLTVRDTGECSGSVQPILGSKKILTVVPATGTTGSSVLHVNGGTYSSAGTTFANPTLSSTSLVTQARRVTAATSATGGTVAEFRGGQLECWRGNGVGLGGFLYRCRFDVEGTLQSGMRSFFGLVDITTAQANYDPTSATAPGKIGMAINASTGNWNFVNNITATAPTVTGLGSSFPVSVTALYDLTMYCAPNGGTIFYRVVNVGTGAVASGSVSSNLPASTTFLNWDCWVTNNATAGIATMGLCNLYLETPS